MNPPTVSILIPAHNVEAWLAATLDSVLAQSYPDIEVIVVDDGSTDRTAEVARGYQAAGIRLVSQPNSGAASARNHALRLARGSLIKFLDADDLLAPDAVAQQVAALADRPKHLALGVWARFHTRIEDAAFHTKPGWHDAAPIDWIKETWADTEPMYQCGLFLIPRALLDAVGGWDERLSLIDDFEFFTRLVLASDGIAFTPGARLYYRSRLPGSLSARKSRAALESAEFSTRLAVGRLLAAQDNADTRRLSAGMLKQLVFSIYPDHPDLVARLLAEIARLGGSSLTPPGGAVFQFIARTLGWRLALRLRKIHNR